MISDKSKNKAGRQEVIAAVYLLVMLLPNIFLACTEPYSWSTVLCSLLLPGGVYAALAVAAGRPGVPILCSLPFMVLGAFQIVLLYLFGGSIIAVDMFTNLFTTNASEAGELLGSIWPSVVFVCAVYLPLIALGIRSLFLRDRLRPVFRRRVLVAAAGAFVLGCSFAGVSAACRPGFGIRYHVFPVDVIYNIRLALQRWDRSNAYPETSRDFRFDAVRSDSAGGREIYVLVVGEASRAASWSLFGYERPTTPLLERRDGLVPFPDVLTQSNATHKSVPVLLSSVSAENYGDIYSQKSILTAFKEAGFETLFISNQVPNRSLIDYFSFEADAREDISPREGELYTDNRPDGDMLPILERAIASTDSNMFIVLHTYGSHMDYTKRYPREFARFTPDLSSAVSRENRETVRNAYDNSVYYTDWVLDRIIGLLENTDAVSALFYCADHGEDLMDDDRGRFLHASPTPTYYQLHVACFAWFSENYRERFPLKYETAAAHRLGPSTTGAVFHHVADMASLRGRCIDSTQAFSSAAFAPRLRRMYLNDHDRAVEFYNSGLDTEDFDMLDRHRIEYDRSHRRKTLY
ncbi:phosphoethanolamine transferase [uncultured Alistipes sp.]|uniref:phosphoethanolamine transferase n=1 Tax=uncultured Alistipes sp. TaxID=538949 RepID=UPI00262EA75D|nr:phosphoethanolamine transferase [uncultured Alistipes sp.]